MKGFKGALEVLHLAWVLGSFLSLSRQLSFPYAFLVDN